MMIMSGQQKMMEEGQQKKISWHRLLNRMDGWCCCCCYCWWCCETEDHKKEAVNWIAKYLFALAPNYTCIIYIDCLSAKRPFSLHVWTEWIGYVGRSMVIWMDRWKWRPCQQIKRNKNVCIISHLHVWHQLFSWMKFFTDDHPTITKK